MLRTSHLAILLLATSLWGCQSIPPVSPEKTDVQVQTSDSSDVSTTSQKDTEQAVKKESPVKPELTSVSRTLGEQEFVRVKPANVILIARIDTGATSTSIHARNIKYFEQDGEKWLSFEVPKKDRASWVKQKAKLAKMKTIKRKGNKDQQRPVVKMHVTIGNVGKWLDVNLANRSNFTYPFLIGRDFISDFGVVDVTRKNINGVPSYE